MFRKLLLASAMLTFALPAFAQSSLDSTNPALALRNKPLDLGSGSINTTGAMNVGAITAPTMTLNGTGTALSVTNSAGFGTGGSVPITIESGNIIAGGASNFNIVWPSAHNAFFGTSNGNTLRITDPGSTTTGLLTLNGASSDGPLFFNTTNSANPNQSLAFYMSGGSQSQIELYPAPYSGTYSPPPVNAFNCNGAPGFLLICNNADTLAGGGPGLLTVINQFGGAGTTGARSAANIYLTMTHSTSDTTNQFYSALNTWMETEGNAGGTSTQAAGTSYGLAVNNVQSTGATYYIETTGIAVEMQLLTGSSTLYGRGVDIQLEPSNAVAPSVEFLAYTVASAVEGQGTITCGYCAGRHDSHNPFAAGATFMGFDLEPGDANPTITNGIDFHLMNFTGNTWNDGHVTISGAGDSLLNSATALATTATAGFVHLPNSAGAPTGTPATISGDACEINTSTETLNCYIGSSWYHIALTSGAG